MSDAKPDRVNRLADEIADMPPGPRDTVRRGFEIAAGLTGEKRQQIIELILKELARGGGSVNWEGIAKATGLPRMQVGYLMAALSTAVALLTQNPASAEEFVELGRGKIFHEANAPAVLGIALLVADRRSELERSEQRHNLASAVLPSLISFEVAVDVRFSFGDDDIEDAVPVALVHVDTDGMDQELWLQMTRGDIDVIVDKLRLVAKQMDAAENLVKGAQSERGK